VSQSPEHTYYGYSVSDQPHASIPGWGYFRYDVFPPALGPFRVAVERMSIRDFAAVLENKVGVLWRDIAGCSLVNDRVDQ
jgi:hypothetical protein